MSQERLLLDFIERLDRHREGRVAIHIQLSKLKPANRKEMHIRIAADTFRQLVKKYEGQLFQLGNADMMFICKNANVEDIEEAV